jgi:prepilin-type N-terminal cleavage/methylation domain-containing protein/prepilin-type processing-associated H-X9-DG protein
MYLHRTSTVRHGRARDSGTRFSGAGARFSGAGARFSGAMLLATISVARSMCGRPNHRRPDPPPKCGRALRDGPSASHGPRRAFTLIELLVVIAIISTLLAIMLPNLARARARARTTRCAANLHTLGLALNLYLDEFNGNFFRYYTNSSATDPLGKGRLWWFGFEPNGPGSTAHRPLNTSLSPLAPYTLNLDSRLQCPDFPYDDPFFFPKFDHHAASYGFNWSLGPPSYAIPATIQRYANRMNSVVAFADAVHFDNPPKFNEAHYLQFIPGANQPSGYAHFRHGTPTTPRAQILFLDGHVDSQPLAGPIYRLVANSPTGNLNGTDTTATIYGF